MVLLPFLFLKLAELTKNIFPITNIHFNFLSISIHQIAFEKLLNIYLSLGPTYESPASSETHWWW